MDDIDRRIVELLQADGRRSKRSIARALGTSENLIRKRLKRLEEEGTAKNGLVVDVSVLGLTSATWVFIRATSEQVEEIAKSLTKESMVTLLSLVSGRFDIILYVIGRSDPEVDAFVQRQVDRFAGIMDVDVRPVRRTDLYRYELIALAPLQDAADTASGQ